MHLSLLSQLRFYKICLNFSFHFTKATKRPSEREAFCLRGANSARARARSRITAGQKCKPEIVRANDFLQRKPNVESDGHICCEGV